MARIDQYKVDCKEAVNYTMISYRNPEIDCWSIPQAIQGVGEEAERAFITSSKRACVLGQVPPQNIGLEAWAVALFNDSTGEITILDKPRLLVTLEGPGEVTPVRA